MNFAVPERAIVPEIRRGAIAQRKNTSVNLTNVSLTSQSRSEVVELEARAGEETQKRHSKRRATRERGRTGSGLAFFVHAPRLETRSSRVIPIPVSSTTRRLFSLSPLILIFMSALALMTDGSLTAAKRSLSSASDAFETSSRRNTSRLL